MTLDSGGKEFFQPAGLHAVVGLRNPGRRTPLMFQNTSGSEQPLKPGLRCRLHSALRVQGATALQALTAIRHPAGVLSFR